MKPETNTELSLALDAFVTTVKSSDPNLLEIQVLAIARVKSDGAIKVSKTIPIGSIFFPATDKEDFGTYPLPITEKGI